MDGKTIDDLIEYGLPVIVAAVFVLSLALTIQRAGMVLGWSAEYNGSGAFLVESCTEDTGLGADQWRCAGTLFADDAAGPLPSTLVTSSGALVSDRPYVGERFEVFFKPERIGKVFPEVDRLNELTRLYLSILPRLLFTVGAAIWLAGWLSTRRLDPDDFLARDAVRLPQRFLWRSRGATWMVIGVVAVVVNYVVVTRVIGSLGIA